MSLRLQLKRVIFRLGNLLSDMRSTLLQWIRAPGAASKRRGHWTKSAGPGLPLHRERALCLFCPWLCCHCRMLHSPKLCQEQKIFVLLAFSTKYYSHWDSKPNHLGLNLAALSSGSQRNLAKAKVSFPSLPWTTDHDLPGSPLFLHLSLFYFRSCITYSHPWALLKETLVHCDRVPDSNHRKTGIEWGQ